MTRFSESPRRLAVFWPFLLLTACSGNPTGLDTTDIFVGNSTSANVQMTVDGPADTPRTVTLAPASGGETFSLHLNAGDPVTFHAEQAGQSPADLTCNIDASVVGSSTLVASAQVLPAQLGQSFHVECGGSGWQ
jgi:hypothetical protein